MKPTRPIDGALFANLAQETWFEALAVVGLHRIALGTYKGMRFALLFPEFYLSETSIVAVGAMTHVALMMPETTEPTEDELKLFAGPLFEGRTLLAIIDD